MGFQECEEVMPAATFFSLEKDGDTAHVLFVGEPIPREESFKGQPRVRAYFPIVTQNGLQVWGIGSKLYRKLRDAWVDYMGICYLVTRVGEAGSTATTYGFKKTAIPAAIKRKYQDVGPKEVKAFLVEVAAFGETEDVPPTPGN